MQRPVQASRLRPRERHSSAAASHSDRGGIMAAPPQLAALQAWMMRAVSGREGVDATEHVCSSNGQSPAARLAVYQHAYLARLMDCLREMFPILVKSLGR